MSLKCAGRVLMALGIACCAIPAIYLYVHRGDAAFLQGVMGNWLATTIGVVVGIPVALAINRHGASLQEEKDVREREMLARERQLRVIGLLEKELSFNLSYLEEVGKPLGDAHSDARRVHVGSVRDVFWNTFSSGDDVRWLVDADAIEAISLAYYCLRGTIHLERQYFAAVHFPTADGQDEKILMYLRKHDVDTLAAIRDSLATLRRLRVVLDSAGTGNGETISE